MEWTVLSLLLYPVSDGKKNLTQGIIKAVRKTGEVKMYISSANIFCARTSVLSKVVPEMLNQCF